MSFIKITKTNTDNSLVRLHPSRSFSSSSSGVTGSVRVIAQSSPSFKDVTSFSPFIDSPVSDESVEAKRASIFETGDATAAPVNAATFISGTWNHSVDPLGADPPNVLDGLTLTFKDLNGTTYSATTDRTVTKANSTATKIGVGSGGGMGAANELVESIKNSIDQARQFGVDSTIKDIRDGTQPDLKVLPPTVDGTGAKLFLTQSIPGRAGNTEFGGTLFSESGFTGPSPLSASNFSGGVGGDLTLDFQNYLDFVGATQAAARQSKYVEVLRFVPTNTLTSDSVRKSVYRKNLLPMYKTEFPDSGFNYTNYQSFNFVSSSAFPSASALVYPAPKSEYLIQSGFTFSFNVNVNRNAGLSALAQPFDYPAGTVLFRSSSYAVSIVSGSSKNFNGEADKFRVLLQLSGAVDTDPQKLDLTSLPENTFLSSDNVLLKNHWHNVAVSYGKDHNSGTGSFFIDGIKDADADFTLGTAGINLGLEQTGIGNFGVMIGARFSGSNDEFSGFFNSAVSSEGVFNGGAGSEPHPSGTVTRFNGELNDIRIHSNVLSPDQILTGSQFGLTSLPRGLVFYVPCFFVKESPVRNSLLTPFQQETTGTQEPYNVKLDFGVDGRDINVQNFTREFVQKTHPRLHFLTASTINTSTSTKTANEFLLESGPNRDMHRARGMFILPCDNGKFLPGWALLVSGTASDQPLPDSPMSMFVDDLGNRNMSIVTNNNMMSTASIFEGLMQVNADGSDDTSESGLVQQIVGSSPEDASVDPGSGFTILQRTRDNSSNQVVFFDASNLFYGNRIEPSTFVITSQNLSGTSGSISMKLADNGRGGLYRADALSKNADFSRVGDLLYFEGIAAVQHPCIPFFGKNNFQVSFQGDQNIHVHEVNVPALAGTLNSSSNPSFVVGAKDDYASTYEGNALGISSILFHDENFNVVARTTLAQPILKTEFDKYLFRVKFDF